MGAYGMDEQCAAGGVTCLNKGIGQGFTREKMQAKRKTLNSGYSEIIWCKQMTVRQKYHTLHLLYLVA